VTEVLATLASANPVPQARQAELDEYARALAPTWLAVHEREVRSRKGRQYAIAVVACLALLAAAGTAVALRTDWLDFSRAEPAPPRIVQSFTDFDVGAPPGMASGVNATEARRVPVPNGAGRVYSFWVAPTKHGGFCFEIDKAGGGCDKLGTVPLAGTWAASAVTEPGEPQVISKIYGHANSRYVASVVVRYEDGETARPPVVWVSPPIHAGFFFLDVPTQHRRAGHAVMSLEALDRDGNLVSEELIDASDEHVPPRYVITDEKREVARIRTADGDAVLWTAPTRYDSFCSWLELDGVAHRVAPCLPAGYDREPGVAIRFVPTPTGALVVGRVGPRFREAVMQFADSAEARAVLRDGLLVYAIPRDHLTTNTQLAVVRLVPTRGDPVALEVPSGTPGQCGAPLPSDRDCG
jgi:hypothetical protein